jgi:ATP-binding cassette, subfamily C (CFTR/MRP), member 1
MFEEALEMFDLQGSVWSALWHAFGRGWAIAGLIKLVHDCVNLSSPYLLRQLLRHMQDKGERGLGLLWALALFACGLAVPLLVNQYFVRVFNVSLFMKTSLIQFLYAKSLRISLAAKAALGEGSVANLQSNDAAKLYNLAQYGHVIWSGPFQVLIIIYSLHTIIGWWPALAGFAATVLLVPLNTVLGKVVHRLRRDLIQKTDTRVKVITEIINGTSM